MNGQVNTRLYKSGVPLLKALVLLGIGLTFWYGVPINGFFCPRSPDRNSGNIVLYHVKLTTVHITAGDNILFHRLFGVNLITYGLAGSSLSLYSRAKQKLEKQAIMR